MPRNTLLLTFDDGYFDNYHYVFPLLKKYEIKATFFINTQYISKSLVRIDQPIKHSSIANLENSQKLFNEHSCTSDQYMTWDEIIEMKNSNLADFQCHTHQHGVVFDSHKLENVIVDQFQYADYHNYDGRPQIGYPVFKSRGNTSTPGFRIKKDALEAFQAYIIPFLEEKKKVVLEKGKQFFRNYPEPWYEYYTESEFEYRCKTEIQTNKQLLEHYTGIANANAYAWTYGHQGKRSKDWMKKMGIRYFFTCKKGTNCLNPNPDSICRNELRQPTLFKLKLMTVMNSNLLLGSVFRLIS